MAGQSYGTDIPAASNDPRQLHATTFVFVAEFTLVR